MVNELLEGEQIDDYSDINRIYKEQEMKQFDMDIDEDDIDEDSREE